MLRIYWLDRKFVDWVKANHPSEIVESVRESSIDVLLDKFQYLDDLVIDPNGEPVDWLEGSISDPYLVTKFQGSLFNESMVSQDMCL